MKTYNKIFLLIIFLCFSLFSYGQRHKKPQNLPRYDFKKIHFGFTLGINSLNFNLAKNDDFLNNDSLLTLLASDQKGFNLGIVSNFRLGKYTDLRFIPTLVFGERILNYQFNNQSNLSLTDKRIESTLIDFPVSLKYKSARYNNFRTYVMCGVKYSLDIASQSEIDDEGQELVKLNNHDFMIEGGFGIDFYLQYFKFSPQIKISHGIINILSKDKTLYTQTIDNLKTNSWMISFTFE
ncbi:MAG: outer membrane beta-barrel protein [Flavobacteriales bacterium]